MTQELGCVKSELLQELRDLKHMVHDVLVHTGAKRPRVESDTLHIRLVFEQPRAYLACVLSDGIGKFLGVSLARSG